MQTAQKRQHSILTSMTLLAIAASTSVVTAANASVITTTTKTCFDETTGVSYGSSGCGSQASSTVTGFGTGDLFVTLEAGAGEILLGNDEVQMTAEVDTTVVAYTAGPLRPGFISISYFSDHENDGSGVYGGSMSIDGLLPSGGSASDIPYEIGTPFTLRARVYAGASCPGNFGNCGVGAFISSTDIWAHYLVPDGANELWVSAPILDFSPLAAPEPRSSAMIILFVAIALGVQSRSTVNLSRRT